MTSILQKLKQFWKWLVGLIVVGTMTAGILSQPTVEERIIDEIGVFQASYFAKNGQYWQGLPTHDFLPSKKIAPNRLSRKPHYQNDGWEVMGLPDELPFQVTVDTLAKGPAGNKEYGYKVVFKWKDNENEYVKSIGYGVEAERFTFERITPLPVITATTTP